VAVNSFQIADFKLLIANFKMLSLRPSAPNRNRQAEEIGKEMISDHKILNQNIIE
jgi:hypothetical protein